MSQEKARGPAAKTTIVGGQPPGNDRDAARVPVGLEELLGLAAAEPAFADALLDAPQAAARAAGVELSPAEGAILAAVGRDSVTRMIAEVREQQPEQERRAFLEQAALALTVLVGGGAAAAGCEDESKSSKKKRPARQPVDTGARPDRPQKRQDAGAVRPGIPRGIRPDRPRPRRVPQRTTGISPDRLRQLDPLPKITGIRPRRDRKSD